MIYKIAWRNVWRSPGRTITIILAIVVGVVSLSFLSGFINGFINSFVSNGINKDYSHIQLHHPEFKKDRDISFVIEDTEKIASVLDTMSEVKSWTSRGIVSGMVASSKTATGLSVYGIDPESEDKVTSLSNAIVEGTYFDTKSRNPILISTKTAEKLKLKIRSKVVVTFQKPSGEITASSFRVEGIFDSKSMRINEGVVYVKSDDILKMLESDKMVHEVAILLNNDLKTEQIARKLHAEFPNTLVETWNVLAPELELMQSQVGANMGLILVIIMGALLFGIINTMLMAVLERTRELGMLMAVGMKKTRVFWMIMLETLLMALVGAPIGFAIGLTLNTWLANRGLDLSAYSEGLREFGYETLLYPSVSASDYLLIAVSVGLTALFASIWPARKATKLKPVEALHTI